MEIQAKTIEHNDQRFNSIGDYWDSKEGLQVRVSRMSKPGYEWLCLIHEFVEKALMDNDGVTEPEVMAFDVKFEAERDRGEHNKEDEPGDAPGAPYKRQHCYATAVERLLCAAMGLDWNDYEEEAMGLAEGYPRK